MSIKDLESAMLRELRVVAKDNKIRLKDIMEWQTSELTPHEGEALYFLPDLEVWCCVKKV